MTSVDEIISSNVTVLLVDDEPEILEELAELLGDCGHRVLTAAEPTKALSMIVNNSDISVVISDITMPRMTGLEMIEKASQLLPESRDIEFIVVTGNADTKRAVKALRLGAFDFIQKPVNPDILVHTVDKAVESCGYKQLERKFKDKLTEEVARRTSEVIKISDSLKELNHALELKNSDLEAANQVKSDFLSLISHELRTPLSLIMGFSELLDLEVGVKNNENIRLYNKQISEAGANLLGIFDTIFDLVNVKRSDYSLQKTNFNLVSVIQSLSEIYTSKAKSSGVELIQNRTIDSLMIDADKSLITQAIGSILDNAISYSKPVSTVVVDLLKKEKSVVISISDQGIGMSEEEIHAAKEAFRQVDGSSSKAAYGLGLGLTLSNLVVEKHGGDLSITSTPNKGSVVSIELPLKRELA